MEQSRASTRLAGVVHDLASQVVSALGGGGHPGVVCGPAGVDEDDEIGIAAVRVLGADVLLPSAMFRRPPGPSDLLVFRKAVLAFPPGPGSSAATAWSHWAMTRTLHTLDDLARNDPAPADALARVRAAPDDGEPDASWLRELPWQAMSHQVAALAALAVPGGDCGLLCALRERSDDLARGFVRAVRRRDWLQAAGTGRWLAVLDAVPGTLGLDGGLEFVLHMGGEDPRVALHVQAARLVRSGACA